MELTFFATWLNTFFAAFDYAGLELLHALSVRAGNIFTPIFIFISLLGEKGVFFISLGIVLTIIKKTRKIGVCILIAICLGALMTNVILKDWVARPRPFEASQLFYEWWQVAQSQAATDRSFPSGHVTITMATAMAVFLTSKNKKVAWLVFLGVVAMGLSRVYLVVHYPSDVLGGILVGSIAGIAAYLIVKNLPYFANGNLKAGSVK